MTELPGLTPSQTVGPYLAIGLIRDLITQRLVDPADPRAIRIDGMLYDGAGEPVQDGMIEIWQANAAGRYAHPADDRAEPALEDGFLGFGRSGTVDGGPLRVRHRQARPRAVARRRRAGAPPRGGRLRPRAAQARRHPPLLPGRGGGQRRGSRARRARRCGPRDARRRRRGRWAALRHPAAGPGPYDILRGVTALRVLVRPRRAARGGLGARLARRHARRRAGACGCRASRRRRARRRGSRDRPGLPRPTTTTGRSCCRKAGWSATQPSRSCAPSAPRVGEETARWVHLGATSQDIMDTAAMLVTRHALGLVLAELSRVDERLRDRWPARIATRRWPAAPCCSRRCRRPSGSRQQVGSSPYSTPALGSWRFGATASQPSSGALRERFRRSVSAASRSPPLRRRARPGGGRRCPGTRTACGSPSSAPHSISLRVSSRRSGSTSSCSLRPRSPRCAKEAKEEAPPRCRTSATRSARRRPARAPGWRTPTRPC